MRTIENAIAERVAVSPASVAILSDKVAPFLFTELHDKIKEVGIALHAAGIGKSSRLAVVLPQGPEAAIAIISICAHAIAFPLTATRTLAEYELEFARASVDAVVLPDWIESPARAAARNRGIGTFSVSKVCHSLAEFKLGPAVNHAVIRHEPAALPTEQSVCLILMSSGSTGMPKLILVTHSNLFDIANKMQRWFCLSADDRSACVMPVHSSLAIKIGLLAPLLLGGSVVIPRDQSPEEAGAWCCQHEPTWFVSVPTFLHAVLDKLRLGSPVSLAHNLRFLAATSAYLPEPVRTGLENFLNVPVLEYYGLGEAGIVAANPASPERKPGTVGLISSDVAILGSDGKQLSQAKVGTIAVRGAGVSPGYIEALPLGQDKVPQPAGADWNPTGDLGVVCERGFLTIVGRTKEIINRGGEKISPYEVEEALLKHPAVREAAAFAVPHPRLGENVGAAVVLKQNAEASAADIQEFLRENVLKPSKIPQQILLIESLPRTGNGKVLRSQLQALFAKTTARYASPESVLETEILRIWHRLCHNEDFGIDDNFFQVGGDSLLAVQMLVEVEGLIGHRIPQFALQGVFTVRQIAQAAAISPSPSSELIWRAQDAGGPPFVFCHGDLSTRGMYVLKLVDLLGADHSIVVIDSASDADGRLAPFEQTARARVAELMSLYPSGPLRLGGYCHGGLLAWAMAHELQKLGRVVESLILIDAPSLNARSSVRKVLETLQGLLALTPDNRRDRLEHKLHVTFWRLLKKLDRIHRSLPRQLARRIKIITGLIPDDRGRPTPLFMQYEDIMARYTPPKLATSLLSIVCEDYEGRFSQAVRPWAKLVREVRRERVPGTHLGAISTNLGDVARIIKAHLPADKVSIIGSSDS